MWLWISRLAKIGVIVAMVGILAYAGVCIAGNVGGDGKPPSIDKAAIAVRVSGEIVYTNAIDQTGTVYTLHGYWEEAGGQYHYHPQDIPLDTRIMGPIAVRRRNP